MNVITLKTGNFYDPEYSEYVFKTIFEKHKFFDDKFNLTPNFIKFLKDNHFDDFLTQYYENRDNFEIDFYNDNDLTEIAF